MKRGVEYVSQCFEENTGITEAYTRYTPLLNAMYLLINFFLFDREKLIVHVAREVLQARQATGVLLSLTSKATELSR
jgi:hypothetical protein